MADDPSANLGGAVAGVLALIFTIRRRAARNRSVLRATFILAAGAATLTGSCSSSESSPVGGGGSTSAETKSADLAESAKAKTALASLRARFVRPTNTRSGAGTAVDAVIDVGSARTFERTSGGLRPVVDKSGVASPATVRLPTKASRLTEVQDDATGMRVGFRLRGANDAAVEFADGLALYAGGGPAGADLVQRVGAEGTEDFLIFDAKPAEESVTYDVTLNGVSGLRNVGGALEMLDESGAPRLRVAPPVVVDERSGVHPAELSVDGCAVDTAPRAPWGRRVTNPGGTDCLLRVSWCGASYPLLVDPGWSTTGAMAIARFDHTASVLGSGVVLVAGGDAGATAFASAELYDPATGTWAATGAMTISRELHTASVLGNGEVLVAGGFSSFDNSAQFKTELYNPSTGTWSATGPMSHQRYMHTATVLPNGKVLVAAGASGAEINTAELYDPVSATWSPTGSLTTARYDHTASLLGNGMVLVAGGEGGGYLSSAELYQPAIGQWTVTGSMAGAHAYHIAGVLPSGKVLVAGGVNGSPTATAAIYDPTIGKWATTDSMASPRYQAQAVVLGSGKVLVAGGDGMTLSLSSAEIFDPNTETWSSGGTMATGRANFAMTMLASGKALAAGGSNVTTAELYDPFAPQGSPCSVGGDCTTGFCVDGVCCNSACGGGATNDCPACSVGMGAVASGTCTLLSGSPCNDGNACTQTDTCQAGACVGSNTVNCSASDSCHDVGVCNPATGLCSNPTKLDGASCDDGNACTQTDACQSGICLGSAPISCSPSDQCHVAGTCNPATGICSNPAKINGATCNDGNACTQADSCQAGTCVGGNPVSCSASDACHTAGTCNPSTGACSNPAKPDGTACDDGNACTLADSCESGVCVGASTVNCPASDQCHVAGTCNPGSGICSNPAKADGTSCDDGDACTQTDRCEAGACTGTNNVICSPQDECHEAGTCNHTSGACSYPNKPDGTACAAGTCEAGVCTAPSSTTSTSTSSASSSTGTGTTTSASSSTTGTGATTSASSTTTGAGTTTSASSTSSSASSASTGSGASTSSAGTTSSTTSTGSGGGGAPSTSSGGLSTASVGVGGSAASAGLSSGTSGTPPGTTKSAGCSCDLANGSDGDWAPLAFGAAVAGISMRRSRRRRATPFG